MLKPLSEILGVSVNELLDGEDKSEELIESCEEDIQNDSVSRVLEYADHVIKRKEYNIGRIFSWILGISLFLAVIQYVTGKDSSRPEWLWSVAMPISFTWLFILWLSVVFYKYKKMKLWLTLAITTLLCIPGEAITNTIASGYDTTQLMPATSNVSIVLSAFFLLCIAGVFVLIGLTRQNGRQKDS